MGAFSLAHDGRHLPRRAIRPCVECMMLRPQAASSGQQRARMLPGLKALRYPPPRCAGLPARRRLRARSSRLALDDDARSYAPYRMTPRRTTVTVCSTTGEQPHVRPPRPRSGRTGPPPSGRHGGGDPMCYIGLVRALRPVRTPASHVAAGPVGGRGTPPPSPGS